MTKDSPPTSYFAVIRACGRERGARAGADVSPAADDAGSEQR